MMANEHEMKLLERARGDALLLASKLEDAQGEVKRAIQRAKQSCPPRYVWKVTTTELTSLFASGAIGMTYPLGEKVYPVGESKLFAFSTLESVVSFSNTSEQLVHLAEAWDVAYITEVLTLVELRHEGEFARFWDVSRGVPYGLSTPPTGTIVCSAIRLVETIGTGQDVYNMIETKLRRAQERKDEEIRQLQLRHGYDVDYSKPSDKRTSWLEGEWITSEEFARRIARKG